MKKIHLPTVVLALAVVILTTASHCQPRVDRVDPTEIIDLSGRWNDSDAQQISDTMVEDLVSNPWIQDHVAQYGKKPVIIVGPVENKSSEHIATEVITKDLERSLVNSGSAGVVASSTERSALREELMQQQTWSSAETQKRLAAETGADYMLIGSINSVIDQSGKEAVIFYKVNLELVHLETSIKTWIGNGEIKKYVKKPRIKL
ncbi:MAG: penicillin-binding protein activator LpoB [Pontiellaceae bacterium]|nr:penicillin-binding protein activator LpoB [Pontiellaceae bacterium]